MNELDLYKFCQNKEMDWRNTREGERLLIWVNFYDIKEFTELVGYNHFDEGGLEVSLQFDCLCIDLTDICEMEDIDPERIHPKDN
jgi:hypothetical protein